MVQPIVTIQEGKLKGKVARDFLGGNYYCFFGIPYGKAPVGDLRFKAPVPVEPWDGIKDATHEGPECPSRHMIYTLHIGSEDNCLNLNVFTKELPNDSISLKPVMVWIHGGGFVVGSNRTELYSPDYLITEDVVIVCINYRTGVLGFLCLEDPSLEIPGNAGLKDMVLALQWVQKNIKSFCGDPNNVTIFGESAGSAAVQYLCLSRLTKGLFHKAIAQSGSSLNHWTRGCSNGIIIAKKLKIKEKDEGKILEYLCKLPSRKLVEAQHKVRDPFNPSVKRPFGPVVEKASDSAFLSEEPIDLIKSGNYNQVPLIMGYTSREGLLFEGFRKLQTKYKLDSNTDFESEIFPEAGLQIGSEKSKEIASKIKGYYFGDEEVSENRVDQICLLKTDNMFLYGIHQSVSLHKLTNNSPIYFYKMTLESSLNQFKKLCTSKHAIMLGFLYYFVIRLNDGFLKNFLLKLCHLIPQKQCFGTCHADDLSYLFKAFNNKRLEPKSPEETYVKRFVKMWTNFAKTGNPTPEKDDVLLNVEWLPVSQEKNYLLNIGSELKMECDPDLERMEFWRNICDNNN